MGPSNAKLCPGRRPWPWPFPTPPSSLLHPQHSTAKIYDVDPSKSKSLTADYNRQPHAYGHLHHQGDLQLFLAVNLPGCCTHIHTECLLTVTLPAADAVKLSLPGRDGYIRPGAVGQMGSPKP